MRLLIIIALLYIAWRGVKSWMLQGGAKPRTVDGKPGEHIDDVMVKDPECGAYFPQRSGVRLRRGGEEFLFCSEACRDQFVAVREKAPED